jgi:transglutaminase-like putative cysteine protease
VERLAELALLFVLLTAATAGVTSVLIAPDWGSLWRSLSFGLLVAWVLATFKQPGWLSALVTLALGAMYSFLFPGGLSARAGAVFFELRLLGSHVTLTTDRFAVDFSALSQASLEFFTAVGVVLERLRLWAAAFAGGEPAFDPVATTLAWNLLVWIVASWSGWVVGARKNALLAVLPAILLSVSALSYSQHGYFTLYLLLGMSLILLAITQHDRRKQEWDQGGVIYPARKGREMVNTVLVVTGALVILSAVTASLSLVRIVDWLTPEHWASASQDSGLAKSFGIRPATTSAPDVFEGVRQPGLPRDKLIGSGPELSRRVVMTVVVENLQSLASRGKTPAFYWRSFTYDVYAGYGWQTSETRQSAYQANQPLQEGDIWGHVLVQQTIRPIGSQDAALYAAGEPVSVNLPSDAAWRSSGDLFGVQLNGSDAYSALSLYPVAGERTLQSAGQRYPSWVSQRYLALPPEVPERVKGLAIELTAAEPTPYDRARAIVRYLRAFPYTLDVPRPPVDRDLVDYFLFDLKEGYCDYYASAMVVLARAAGVPARLAIGYANGTYDLNSKRFQVTEADAHTWAEIYFPKIGWVPFEATASRPELSELGGAPQVTATEIAPQLETPSTGLGLRIVWGWYLLAGGLAGAVVLGVAWFIFDGMRLRRLPQPAAAVEVYRRMRRYGILLAAPIEAGDTPYEFAASLGERVQELAEPGFNPVFGERTIEEIRGITHAIVRLSYNPMVSASAQDAPVFQQWMGLRWRLSLVWALKYWKAWREHLKNRWDVVIGRSSGNVRQEG